MIASAFDLARLPGIARDEPARAMNRPQVGSATDVPRDRSDVGWLVPFVFRVTATAAFWGAFWGVFLGWTDRHSRAILAVGRDREPPTNRETIGVTLCSEPNYAVGSRDCPS